MTSEARFPAEGGSYLLWMYLSRRQMIAIGRRGVHSFERGWYGYCGSAFGPGGLRARLRHHLRPVARCHWHIDYLKQWARPRAVWLCRGDNLEHRWSGLLQGRPGAGLPLPGFGSSDCDCPAHLVYFRSRRQVNAGFAVLAAESRILRINWDNPDLC